MRVYKPKRRKWSQRQLLAVYDSTKGKCHLCGRKIMAGETWTPDHVVRLADGGLDEIENLTPVHRWCHAGKTAFEAHEGAKADRVAAKHLGVFREPRRVLPGSRNSKWKIRLDRRVIRRDQDR